MLIYWWLDLSYCLFFFKQKTAYEMRISDWSSDVCSSDLSRYVIAQRHRRTRRNIGQGGIADAIDAESEFECGRIDARLDHQRISAARSQLDALDRKSVV